MIAELLIHFKISENRWLGGLLPYSKWALTIPISNNEITLSFAIDSSRVVTATQFEGGMIKDR